MTTSDVGAELSADPDVILELTEPAHPADPTVVVAGRPHFPCFDGLRALAAFAVLIHHVGFATGWGVSGRYGEYIAHLDFSPPVFFMVSAFLLYRPFVRDHLRTRPFADISRFFWHRALRVLPAFWISLLLVYLIFGFVSGALAGPRDILTYFGLVQIYDTRRFFAGMSQAWTLNVELTFYLLLPLYAFGIRRISARVRMSRIRVEMIGLVCLFLASYVWRISLYTFTNYQYDGVGAAPWSSLGTRYWIPALFDIFALGMGLAVASAWLAEQRETPAWARFMGRWPSLWWGIAGFLWWFVSTQINFGRDLSPLTAGDAVLKQFIYSIISFTLVIPAAFGNQDEGWVRKLLRAKPVAYFGMVSYGIYLWHQGWIGQAIDWLGYQPVFFKGGFDAVVAVTFIVLAGAIACGSLSYYLIERPLMRFKDNVWFRRSPTRSKPRT